MARHAPPIECCDVGDRVAVTYQRGDMTIMATGVIGSIERRGRERDLRTPQGELICTYSLDAPRKVQVMNCQAYQPRHTQLPIDELMEAAND